MASRLPQQVREKIICIVYRKADEFAYMECDRVKMANLWTYLWKTLMWAAFYGSICKRTYTHLYQGHDS